MMEQDRDRGSGVSQQGSADERFQTQKLSSGDLAGNVDVTNAATQRPVNSSTDPIPGTAPLQADVMPLYPQDEAAVTSVSAAPIPTHLTSADADNQSAVGQNAVGQNAAQQGALQSSVAQSSSLLSSDEAVAFRSRWDAVQTGFVDEPRQAVEQADALVAQAIQRLAETFTTERAKLEGQWSRGTDVSTEDLRVTLQRYRSFFDRLLHI